MHVIVVVCGRVGSELASSLSGGGHEVVVMDKRAEGFRRLPDEFTGRTVVGLGFDRDALRTAGIDGAGALAAVTSGDNSNVLTARIAREYFHVPNVVARIYDPRRAVIYQRLGIPTVATVTWTIDQVRRRLLPEQIDREWADATGKLQLVERRVPDTWAGRRLGDLSVLGRISILAVTRAGVPRLDATDLIGQEGDLLHVAVSSDALDELEERLTKAGGA